MASIWSGLAPARRALAALPETCREPPVLYYRQQELVWILRTTRNYCLDQLRRRAKPSTPILVDDVLLDQQPDDLASDPSHAADSAFRMEQARAALRQLPENLRSVFVLYEVNGLRYREIARTLNLPINSVKAYLFRARAKLSKLISKEEPWTNICSD